jgi:release factor glutamine methyltransferase
LGRRSELQVESEDWTPLRLLKWTTEYFVKHAVEEARLDAELLLAKALGVDRIMLYAGFERVVTPDELRCFREMVRQRAAGRPAKYIVGATEFYSLPFAVDERVLIPRPETELLVERALSVLRAAATAEFQLVVEIGTGSGAISVALAANYADASYIATDISSDALDVARANAEANKVASKIEFLQGDLLAPLSTIALEGRVDMIVCNPPYVSEQGWAALAREIRTYEPRAALVAGPDGCEFHLRLVTDAVMFLRPGGTLLVEMDGSQKDSVATAVSSCPEYFPATFHQDYAKMWRFYELQRR